MSLGEDTHSMAYATAATFTLTYWLDELCMTQSRSSGPAEDIVLEAAGARTEEEEMASVNISPTGSEVSQCKLIAEYGRGCCRIWCCWGNVRRWEALLPWNAGR